MQHKSIVNGLALLIAHSTLLIVVIGAKINVFRAKSL